MKSLSGPARNAATRATSVALPTRPNGVARMAPANMPWSRSSVEVSSPRVAFAMSR